MVQGFPPKTHDLKHTTTFRNCPVGGLGTRLASRSHEFSGVAPSVYVCSLVPRPSCGHTWGLGTRPRLVWLL